MIKKKLDEMKRKEICKALDISRRTLHNWENDKHIENTIKYIELLYRLGIDPKDKVEEYKKKESN